MSEEEVPLKGYDNRDHKTIKSEGIKMGFLLSLIFTVGIGAF